MRRVTRNPAQSVQVGILSTIHSKCRTLRSLKKPKTCPVLLSDRAKIDLIAHSTMSHPWDDLEQRFTRFAIATVELVRSIPGIVDREDVPNEIIDKVSNVVNGIADYVDFAADSICDDMESKISFDYANRPSRYQQTVFFSEVKADGEIEIPVPILDQLNWSVGDSLQFTVSDDNSSILIRKIHQ